MRYVIKLIVFSFVLSNNVWAADKIEKAGDFLQILVPSVAYGLTFTLGDVDGREQFYKSFGTTFVVTHGLKNLVRKKRPSGSLKSFPSGHTSAAFQGASFIHKRYGFEYSVPAYLAASFVAYSRVNAKKHYIEDVLAGASIGIASNYFFTKTHMGFRIKPISKLDGGHYGVSVFKEW